MKTRVSHLGQICLSLVFCLSLSACNQDEFYAKEYLDNSFQGTPSNGSESGGGQGGPSTGGTQGGVDGGSQGGTDGGTTSGSTTGGPTTGGTDGSSTGGTDGSATGGSTAGETTGGSTAGTTSGSTTAGTNGGSATGGVTGGSTTGGTTGGDTGSSTGGSTTGGVSMGEPVSEKFKQSASETKKIDIVWVIDNSGSMADEQTALGSNFDAFINSFIDMNVDFKMAITTTDVTSGKKGVMVRGSAEKLTSAAAKANEAKFKSDFKSLVKVGITGSGDEKGLEASEGFMQNYANTFLREDAYLVVVILSDEEDQSPKAPEYYTDFLKGFKKEAGLIKVYSIVDTKTDPKNSGRGMTYGYARYKAASVATAGTVASIRDDFYKVLGSMGETILNLLDSFALGHDPIPGTPIQVLVNGVEVSGYTFNAASRSIKFNQETVPPEGADITVNYRKK